MNKIYSIVSEKINKGAKNLSLNLNLTLCSKKLPKTSGYYLVISKYGGLQLLHFSSKFLKWNATDDDIKYAFRDEEIYAWVDDDSILINVDDDNDENNNDIDNDDIDIDNNTDDNDNVNNVNWTPGMIATKLLLAYYYGRRNASTIQVKNIISMNVNELTQAFIDNII